MLIIFDCDGVLVDSELMASKMLSRHLASHGVDVRPEKCRELFTGMSIKSVVYWVAANKNCLLPENFETSLKIRDREHFTKNLRAVKGIHQVLGGLTLDKCVASSGSLEKIRHSLQICGLSKYFKDNLFSASMVKYGKPAPYLFLHAASAKNKNPQHCIVIEDSVPGVKAAVAAGMTCFGFFGGSHAQTEAYPERLMSAGAHIVFGKMEKLPALINSALINRAKVQDNFVSPM